MVTLQKGQKAKLADLFAGGAFELQTTLRLHRGAVDISCFGVDRADKLADENYFVFYNQLSTPEQAICMTQQDGGTVFSIDLQALPEKIEKLVVTAAADGDICMSEIAEGSFQLSAAGSAVATHSFTGADFQQERAIILCEIYRKGDIWRISVVSSGFNGGLSALLAHFGGEEAAPEPSPTPTPNPAPAPTPAPASIQKPAPPAANPVTITKPTPAATPNPPPAAPPPEAPRQPISLVKPGDSHKISLSKGSPQIHINLNWNQRQKTGLFGTVQNIDLDLACLYRLKDGRRGIVQALGNAFGSQTGPPYIQLDHDDRSGASQNGENMVIARPEEIDLAVVFAYIYEGVANWNSTNAVVVLKQPNGPDISIAIHNSNSKDRFCAIASLRANGGELDVRREGHFLKSHRAVDQYYGFGLKWTSGSK